MNEDDLFDEPSDESTPTNNEGAPTNEPGQNSTGSNQGYKPPHPAQPQF